MSPCEMAVTVLVCTVVGTTPRHPTGVGSLPPKPQVKAKNHIEPASDATDGIARRQRARRVAHRHLEGSSTLNDERATRRHVPGARTTNLVQRTSS
jgi:hypothetical protein